MRALMLFLGVAGLCWPNTLEDAKRAFDSNNYDLAAQLFEKAQKESPACDTLLFLGVTRYRMNQMDAALTAFQSAIECDPKLVTAHLALAEAYGVRGNEAHALAALERLLAMDPNHPVALRHVTNVYLRNESNDKAVPLLERLLKADENDLEVRIDLAAAYAATGNRSGAEREYREALRRKPDSASALTGLANLSLKSGADEEAISYLMKAVSIAPNAFEPRFLLGSVYNRLGQFQEAESALQAALRLGGEGPEVYYHLARTYAGLDRQEDRRKALARFNELTKQSKNEIEAQRHARKLVQSAEALAAAGRLNAAVDELEQAQRLRPQDDSILYQLAALCFDLRQYLRAEEYVTRAISIAPSRWLYHYLLGNIAINGRKLQAARNSLEVAVKLNPSAAEAHNALGNAALQMNEPDVAVAAFQRASELDPRESAYRLNLEGARRSARR